MTVILPLTDGHGNRGTGRNVYRRFVYLEKPMPLSVSSTTYFRWTADSSTVNIPPPMGEGWGRGAAWMDNVFSVDRLFVYSHYPPLGGYCPPPEGWGRGAAWMDTFNWWTSKQIVNRLMLYWSMVTMLTGSEREGKGVREMRGGKRILTVLTVKWTLWCYSVRIQV